MDDCLVIIFIAETDAENVFQISSEIQSQFSKHLESGRTKIPVHTFLFSLLSKGAAPSDGTGSVTLYNNEKINK